MGKRLDITPLIAEAIARSTGGSVNPNEVAVFETVAMNTLPISKKGSLYENAVAREGLLSEMEAFANGPGNFVPLHNNHDQGQMLPIGRVFAAEKRKSEIGVTELRSLFYLPLSESAFIDKIDTGVIEEVSVGVQPKQVICSQCEFDYAGPAATYQHFMERTCENGHTIGTDGTHVQFSGLASWLELSLVSLGAASRAKIQPRTKALMGEQYAHQLAATGISPEATVLFASPTTTKKESSMELTALIAEFTTAKAELMVKDTAIKAADDTIATLTQANTDLKTELDALKAAKDPSAEALQASLTEADAALRGEAERLAVAASLDKPAADATVTQLAETITNARAKLVAGIQTGGLALRSDTGSGEKDLPLVTSSFKTR